MIAALVLLLAAGAHGLPADTRCEACHTEQSWQKVTFDHARTGFPLVGKHRGAACRGCHEGDDFSRPVAQSCSACHRDAHAGEFGTRCASCHSPESWKAAFTPEAHRRTNFPLTGRHAVLPCEECHLGGQRDRTFTRSTVACVACHRSDYFAAAVRSIDHVAAGFGTDCRSCHGPSTFAAARFTAHRACFAIESGPHARVTCLQCHTSLAGVKATGQCNSGTIACRTCHTHSQQRTDAEHQGVPGYQYKDEKCYGCHRFAAVPRVLPAGGRP